MLRELGASSMLYDPSADRTVRLNAMARKIWECCDGSHDVAAIVATLKAVFDAAPDLEADVRRTLRAFAGAGLFAA